jgi:hypothetical protein
VTLETVNSAVTAAVAGSVATVEIDTSDAQSLVQTAYLLSYIQTAGEWIRNPGVLDQVAQLSSDLGIVPSGEGTVMP